MFVGFSAAVNAGLEKAFVKVAHVPGRANAVFLEVCDHLRMHPLTALQHMNATSQPTDLQMCSKMYLVLTYSETHVFSHSLLILLIVLDLFINDFLIR